MSALHAESGLPYCSHALLSVTDLVALTSLSPTEVPTELLCFDNSLMRKEKARRLAVFGLSLLNEICPLRVFVRKFYHFLAWQELSRRAPRRWMAYDSFLKIFLGDKTLPHHHNTVIVVFMEEYPCLLFSCTSSLNNQNSRLLLLATTATATEGYVWKHYTSLNEPVDHGWAESSFQMWMPDMESLHRLQYPWPSNNQDFKSIQEAQSRLQEKLMSSWSEILSTSIAI